MTRIVEFFVALVSKSERTVAGAAGSTLIVDQFNADMKGFQLVNQSAQAGAAMESVLSITSISPGFVPFLNVVTNTLAGTTTFLKIVADYKTDNEFKRGDVVALIGNVAGVVAGVTLMAGFAGVGVAFAGVALAANFYGVYNSDVVQGLYDGVVSSVLEFFHRNDSAGYANYWVAPDLNVVSWMELVSHYGSTIAVANWNPLNNVIVVGSLVFDAEDSGGAGQGGIVFGGGATNAGPLPTLPEALGRIDITLESLNGIPEPGSAVPPSTGGTDGDSDSSNRQDEYACCTGTQDGYY